SYFVAAVISHDHVGMHGNQFSFRMQNFAPTSPAVTGPAIKPITSSTEPQAEALASNVFVLGATVHVSRNREAEGLEPFDAPIASSTPIGIPTNTTSYNTGTRCPLAYQGIPPSSSPASADPAIVNPFLQVVGNIAILAPLGTCGFTNFDLGP